MSPCSLVLLGPHGVGKTTLGEHLARRLSLPFDGEIGRELSEDRSWRGDGTTAADPQEAFDREVFRRELARDERADAPRIIESWHPANLAYAARRSPLLIPLVLGPIRARVDPTRTVILPLQAHPSTLARRATEPGDLRFFRAVGRDAVRWSRALGLRILPALTTDQLDPDALADRVVALWRTS